MQIENENDLRNRLIELNRKKNSVEMVIGTNISILFSKEIFKKNSDIEDYLKKVFEMTYLPYVMKSRSLIGARLTKTIYNYDKENLSIMLKRLFDYFDFNLENKSQSEMSKEKPSISKWIQGIRNGK
ncbi:hypothetical protein E4K67_17545 [Desulfosporosinus fructosivorans]|uniref:Uncharacterized protein n=1 Tax=Desulfosporosinus fructosivorans TaxID=2018669 RepID=A0A4Z0R1G3_9FIRM|nr:hypothetical protein [Desulfosporosinus fructosivorans]TGE36902.1 hypothetical protein E4K67_17545 [Desulfosporosinus fructosivorans]